MSGGWIAVIDLPTISMSQWFGTLVLVSFCVHIWLISAVRSTKKWTLQKKIRCPHFWGTIIDATFGWIDPKKVNSWIHPTVEICWAKKLMKTRKKLLTFVERWDSKGGDNAESQGCLHAMRLESHFLRCWSATWSLISRLGTFGSTRMLGKHPYDDECCKQGNAKHNSKNWV